MVCWIPLVNGGWDLWPSKSYTSLEFLLALPLASIFSPSPVSNLSVPNLPAPPTFPPLQTGIGNGKPFPGAGSQGFQTSCKGEAEVGMMGDVSLEGF